MKKTTTTTIFFIDGIRAWRLGAALAALCCAAATSMAQTTRTVAASGGGDFTTIAAAITAASNGDIIHIIESPHTENNITISKNLTIKGNGAGQTILQAHANRLTAAQRIFTISDKSVTLRDLTLQHGHRTDARGGAMLISGVSQITIERCHFTKNDTLCPTGGANNLHGGAICFDTANAGATMTIQDSTFSSNSVDTINSAANANSNGGAIFAGSIDSLVIRNCTFSGNSLKAKNWPYGGAINTGPGSGETTRIENCTFINNYSSGGGGAVSSPATNYVFLTSCLFADNAGSNLYGPDAYRVTYGDCVYEGKLDGSLDLGTSSKVADAKVNITLAANGGPTPTHALLVESAAINKGSNPNGLSYDQRGPGYPRAWYAPDIGAFEWIPAGRQLAWTTNTFHEWFANNGTINNFNPLRIVLANDTFLGTNGQDFVASSLVTAGNVPAGLTAVVTRTDSNNVLVTLTGTAASHTTADNVTTLTLAFADAAFAGGNAAGVTGSTKSDLNVVYLDAAVTPVLTYTGAGFWEVAANDGSVSNLPIVATLASEHFAGTNGQNLAASGWVTASGLPTGLTLIATKISDFQVNLTLTGAVSLPHNAAQNAENVTFQFLDTAFFSQPAAAITDSTRSGFFVRFLNPVLTYGGTVFSEAILNDGSIANTLALTLAGDNLAGTNGENFVASSKVLASNVPAGLTAVVTRTGPTNLTASLTSRAAAHDFADSIANLTLTFQDSAFSNTVASLVTNYAANSRVSFITNAITYHVATDGVDVGRTGLSPDQAFKTITNALARCRDAASDVVQLGAGTFGQTNIALSKVVVVRGMGRDLTILQGGSDTNTSVNRFFTTSGGNNRPIVIRDLTMRYGGGRGTTGDNNGGAVYQSTQSPLYLFNCTFASNCAAQGGGAYNMHDGNAYYGRLIASNCTFVGNTAFANEGGAVKTVGGSTASFYGCTFMGNTAKASAGGATYMSIPVAMHNSSFWGNRSGTSGGAIWNHVGGSSMYNCTIASNSAGANAGAIYAGSGASTMSIYNSIIGTNTSVTGSANIQPPNGTAFSVYRSVIYGTYAGTTLYDGCITGQDPKVLPPADNEGPVWTCALQSSSPCIGAANATTALAVDQRGYARDATPDIGAFEYGAHGLSARGTVLILY